MDEKIKYLLNIIGHHEFQDIKPPNIYSNLNRMLTKPLIVETEYQSETIENQQEVEIMISKIYQNILNSHQHFNTHFEVEKHDEYITNSLKIPLPGGYKSLDANHSWMLYWLINARYLVNQAHNKDDDDEIKKLAVDKIKTLIVDKGKGGISGGANQLGHLASSYAAILLLVELEEVELLNSIRENLYQWMMSLKQPDGSFIMHYHGEADTRSTYCALVIASLLNLLKDEFTKNCLNWIRTCQTYEGGFSGVPNTEAHGGYTFCALASYLLLNDISKEYLNLDKLIRWLASRQYQIEGGLSGRTNKLVDACYGFWIGGSYALIESILKVSIFDKHALKIYLLNCCQDIHKGGFKDKPNTRVDFYHTNYSLLGLSCAEYSFKCNVNNMAYGFEIEEINDDTNVLPINPIFGIPLGKAEKCKDFFSNL